MKLIIFPNSEEEPFIKTSEATHTYNCVAWALGDNTRFYWPKAGPEYYWPKDIPLETTIEAFILLFESVGYSLCKTPDFEEGFEKIAIYIDEDEIPTHVAKPLNNQLWTSKLGQLEDVSHTFFTLSEGLYGEAAYFMKRKAAKQ